MNTITNLTHSIRTEIQFAKVLNKLPSRDSNLYLLLQDYEDKLKTVVKKYGSLPEFTELKDEIVQLYESAITNLMNESSSKQVKIYETRTTRNDKAVASTTDEPKVPTTLGILTKMARESDEDEFEEKFGKWASRFSDDDEEDHQRNNSDLSSQE